MPLQYLLDENLRGPLWNAFQQHHARGLDPVSVARVGDLPALPLGSPDPDILIWCEREDRVLITLDEKSMPIHLAAHLQLGRHLPGILLLGAGFSVGQWLSDLIIAAYAFDPAEIRDQIRRIP